MKRVTKSIYHFLVALIVFVFLVWVIYVRRESEEMRKVYEYFSNVRNKKFGVMIVAQGELEGSLGFLYEECDGFLCDMVNHALSDVTMVVMMLAFGFGRKYVILNVLQGCLLMRMFDKEVDYKALEEMLVKVHGLCNDEMENRVYAKRKFGNILTKEIFEFYTALKYTFNSNKEIVRKVRVSKAAMKMDVKKERLEYVIYDEEKTSDYVKFIIQN